MQHRQALLLTFFLGAFQFSEAIFFPAAVAGAGAAAVVAPAAATAVSASLAPNLLGIAGLAAGAKILGALALGGGRKRNNRRRRYRGRRDTQDVDVEGSMEPEAYIQLVQELEPEECTRKMICMLAANKQDNHLILNALRNNEQFLERSFKYTDAAKIGHLIGDHRKCGLRYKCSIDSNNILAVANL